LQDVVTLHAVVARQDIADGVVAHMAHVQLARGVREHGQAVVFGLGRIFGGPVGLFLFPVLLGFRFDDLRAVMGVHD
jgi:hypothetical protein